MNDYNVIINKILKNLTKRTVSNYGKNLIVKFNNDLFFGSAFIQLNNLVNEL